jgi:hypothetical protein
MFESFKNFISAASHVTAANAKVKSRERLNKELGPINFVNARKILGYGPDEEFGFFDLQARYFEWRRDIFDMSLKELLRMGRVFDLLYYAAADMTKKNPTTEETAFLKQDDDLWRAFNKKYEENMVFDDAKVIFFTHAFKSAPRRVLIDLYKNANPLEITYLFHTKRESCTSLEHARQFDKAYIKLFCATGMLDISNFTDHPYSLVLDGTLKKPFPLPGVDIELTTASTKEVRQPESIKTPAPVVVVDVPEVRTPSQPEIVTAANPVYTQPRETHNSPPVQVAVNVTIAMPEKKKKKKGKTLTPEVTQTVETPTLSEEPVLVEMTQQEARTFMKYGETETITRVEITPRYWKFKKDPLYADLQDELKTAYNILLKIAA